MKYLLLCFLFIFTPFAIGDDVAGEGNEGEDLTIAQSGGANAPAEPARKESEAQKQQAEATESAKSVIDKTPELTMPDEGEIKKCMKKGNLKQVLAEIREDLNLMLTTPGKKFDTSSGQKVEKDYSVVAQEHLDKIDKSCGDSKKVDSGDCEKNLALANRDLCQAKHIVQSKENMDEANKLAEEAGLGDPDDAHERILSLERTELVAALKSINSNLESFCFEALAVTTSDTTLGESGSPTDATVETSVVNLEKSSYAVDLFYSLNSCRLFHGEQFLYEASPSSFAKFLNDEEKKKQACQMIIDYRIYEYEKAGEDLPSSMSSNEDPKAINKEDFGKFWAKDGVVALAGNYSKETDVVAARLAALISPCYSFARISQITAKHVKDGDDSNYESQDQNFTCRKPSVLTLDYESCTNTLIAYDTSILGKAGLQVGVSGYNAVQMLNAEKDRIKNPNGQVGALDTQKQVFESKRNMAYVQSAGNLASGSALMINSSSMPTPKDLTKQCLDDGDDVIPGLSDQAWSCDLLLYYQREKAGQVGAAENGGYEKPYVFANFGTRSAMKVNAVSNLANGLLQGIIANAFDEMGDSVERVKEEFVDASFNDPQNQLEFNQNFCRQNPRAPSCRRQNGGRLGSGNVDFQFGNIRGGGTTELGFAGEDADLEVGDGNQAAANISSDALDELSGITGPGDADKFDSGFDAAPVAKVGRSGGGGGGGGGGGAAAAGGGGGGGGGPGGGQQAAGGGAPGKVKKATYKTGSGGRFAKGGSAKKKSKAKDNPFNKLFRNKRSRGLASDDAKILPKKIGLFDAISKRYTAVNKEQGLVK